MEDQSAGQPCNVPARVYVAKRAGGRVSGSGRLRVFRPHNITVAGAMAIAIPK
jgi:hypothetical protein